MKCAKRKTVGETSCKIIIRDRISSHDYRKFTHLRFREEPLVLAWAVITESKVKLSYALVGLAALGGAALSVGTASAMPIGLATNTDLASNVEQVRIVCDVYGRCFRTPGFYGYGYGYGGPRYYGGYGWHRGHRHW